MEPCWLSGNRPGGSGYPPVFSRGGSYGQEEKESGRGEDDDAQAQDDAHRRQAEKDGQENVYDETSTAASETRGGVHDALI